MAFVVFAGQSNMGGLGQDASTAPAAWKADPLTHIWNDQAHQWETLQPGVNTGYGEFVHTWGPEVQFAMDFRAEHPGEDLYLVKFVAGGTGIAATPTNGDWSPQTHELLDQASQVIRNASASLDYLHPTAVFWGQGEEDGNYADAAAAYGQNLADLFSHIRSDWLHDPNGKIGFFQIGTSPVYSAEVRAGEAAVDRADANADSFDAGNFPHQSDNLHYTSAGLDQVGDGFYQLFRGWPPGDEGPGLSGNDTLDAPVSGGPLHGGTGADVFSFTNEPWAPVHLTDFAVGQDRLDIAGLLRTVGYAGADPVGDHEVLLQSDGSGGTEVLFDRDGSGPAYPNYIADVEHVSASWSELTTGGAAPASPPPVTGTTAGAGGQGLWLTAPGQLFGSEGADTLQGSSGEDYLRGNGGDDAIFGGDSFDDINGNTGNDVLHGGAGDDWVVGGKNDDQQFGEAGMDIVLGNLGNDTLDGGDDGDQVRGGQGDDVLQGGAGDDWLSGDRGSDTVTGGAGADIFHSFGDAGIDRVTDFHAWEGDRVLLDPGTSYQVAQQGADTVITMSGGGEMILSDVQLSTLPAGWIFGA